MQQPLPPIRLATIFPANAQLPSTLQQPTALSAYNSAMDYLSFTLLLLAGCTFVGGSVFCLLQPNHATVKAIKNNVYFFFKCGKKQTFDGNQYSSVNNQEIGERHRVSF